jgi:hypothetical protein
MLYLVIPEDCRGKNIVKYGRSGNVLDRFRDYGDCQIIAVERVENMILAERELNELARIYFGVPVRGREYYKCEDIDKALEVFYEIVEHFKR